MTDPAAHGVVAPATPPRHVGGPRTVAALLDAPLADDPDGLALVGRTGRFTFAELDAVVNRAAGALRALGVGPGDRVAMSLPNDVDLLIGFLGAMRLGAIWLGINRPLAGPEKAYLLADAGVGVLLATPEVGAELDPHRSDLPDLRELVVVDPAATRDRWREVVAEADPSPPGVTIDPLAPAAIAYTSGTTGFPKGAVHTQHNMLVPGMVSATTGSATPGGVMGVALPLTILNLIVLGPCLAYQCGHRLVAMDRIDAVGMAEWIAAEGITTFSAVPAMVHDLLTDDRVSDDMLASLDAIGVGGADMPDAFRRLYQERFGRRVGTGYGLTEAPTAVTVEDVEAPAVPGSCGRALPQVEIRILGDEDRPLPAGEEGEVCVAPATSGPFADVYRPMLGYWNRPEATADALRDGVLHTGDIGVLDADGNLTIRDRRNDLIIRGGANVYPAEVERVLHDEPAVAAGAVIGVPVERLGGRVVAYVRTADGAHTDAEELRPRCRGQLAAYKGPDTVTFVDGFDRTPMGKIRTTTLREQAAAQAT